MDVSLLIGGVITLLAILGALTLEELIREAHHRGMERVRRSDQKKA